MPTLWVIGCANGNKHSILREVNDHTTAWRLFDLYVRGELVPPFRFWDIWMIKADVDGDDILSEEIIAHERVIGFPWTAPPVRPLDGIGHE